MKAVVGFVGAAALTVAGIVTAPDPWTAAASPRPAPVASSAAGGPPVMASDADGAPAAGTGSATTRSAGLATASDAEPAERATATAAADNAADDAADPDPQRRRRLPARLAPPPTATSRLDPPLAPEPGPAPDLEPDLWPAEPESGPAPNSVPGAGPDGPEAPAVPRPETPGHTYPSLAAAFDNVGITDENAPGPGDIDGTGRSLIAADLAAAGWTPGAPITINGTGFAWPDVRPGRPDNVVADGQRIRVQARGRALSFLVTGTGGGAPTGTGVITYADGTRQAYELTTPDWAAGPSSTKAVALPRRNSAAGPESMAVRIYPVTVPLDPGRAVRTVTLPVTGPLPGPAIHVFALGVRPTGWTGTWSTSTSGFWAVGPWVQQTRRMVVHTSVGGHRTRLRLENSFADRPLLIERTSIAVQDAGAAAAGRPVRATFGGRSTVTIPAGGQVISDPVRFDVPAATNLLVSLYLPGPVAGAPVHSLQTQTSYATAAEAGDHTGDTGGGAFVESYGYWNVLTGVDVSTGPGTLVALGDSITDGYASTVDANERWPDHLAGRLLGQRAVPRYGVVNAGISGNKVVSDRFDGSGPSTDSRGVSAANRLDRDVLAQPDARTVIVFEGINDLRGETTADQVIAGLRQIAARAHAHGLRVVGGTITPCAGWPDCTAAVEAKRQAVNAFLRAGGATRLAARAEGSEAMQPSAGTVPADGFDAIIDFDAVIRDPADPTRIRPDYDSGDHLHPGDAGYRAMAASIDLRALVNQR